MLTINAERILVPYHSNYTSNRPQVIRDANRRLLLIILLGLSFLLLAVEIRGLSYNRVCWNFWAEFWNATCSNVNNTAIRNNQTKHRRIPDDVIDVEVICPFKMVVDVVSMVFCVVSICIHTRMFLKRRYRMKRIRQLHARVRMQHDSEHADQKACLLEKYTYTKMGYPPSLLVGMNAA